MRSDNLILRLRKTVLCHPLAGFLEVSHGVRRPMLHHHPALLAAKWAVGIAGREQNATYGDLTPFHLYLSLTVPLKVYEF